MDNLLRCDEFCLLRQLVVVIRLLLSSCDIRSPLTKTLDCSVETLFRECNWIGVFVHLNVTRVASEIKTTAMLMKTELNKGLLSNIVQYC